jgi:hypothetical protein
MSGGLLKGLWGCDVRSCRGIGCPLLSPRQSPSNCKPNTDSRVSAVAYLPDQRLDATGTAVDLVKRDLANNLVAVLPARLSIGVAGPEVPLDVLAELLDLLDLAGYFAGERLLQRLFSDCQPWPCKWVWKART